MGEKKSAASVTKVFYMQYGASLRSKLQQDLSNDRKKREVLKKRIKCNKGILYMQYGGSL